MKITSTKNQKIKYLKKQKDNQFLLFLDNPKTIREAMSKNLTPITVLISENKQNLLEEFKNFDTIETSDEVISMLSDTKTPQGIIAVFEFSKTVLENPSGDFVVLDNVQDAGNVGTILRSAKGAGFNQIYLVDCAKITNPKVVRSSMGAIFDLKIYQVKKTEFINFAKNQNLRLITCDLDGENIFKTSISGQFGLVLGNEGQGVSPEVKALCTKTVTIPMKNNLESLNVAVAGSIIMFELRKEEL